MAARYDIGFSLVPDENLAISRMYVGVDDNDFAIPGTFIIGMDGTILYRSIGATKDDRVFAAELVARLDELIPRDPSRAAVPGVRGGFAPPARRQLRLGLGLGAASVSQSGGRDTGVSSAAQLMLLQPVSRALMLGVGVAASLGDDERVNADAVLRLRRVFSGDLAELYLQLPLGISFDGDRRGLNSGAAFGLQFAFYPSLAFFFEAAVDVARFASTGSAPAATRAAGRLGLGAGWLF